MIIRLGVSVNGGTPKASILKGCSTINDPFWGTTIYGNSGNSHMKTTIFFGFSQPRPPRTSWRPSAFWRSPAPASCPSQRRCSPAFARGSANSPVPGCERGGRNRGKIQGSGDDLEMGWDNNMWFKKYVIGCIIDGIIRWYCGITWRFRDRINNMVEYGDIKGSYT